jgi:hypothetical protein
METWYQNLVNLIEQIESNDEISLNISDEKME